MSARIEKCVVCGSVAEELLTYSGYPVGYFCVRHRPDKDPEVKTIKDTLLRFKREGEIRPALPLYLSNKRHPFREAARSMVKQGLAVWAQQNAIKLNRAQRRAQMRRAK